MIVMYKEKIFERDPAELFTETIFHSESLFEDKKYIEAIVIQSSLIEILLFFTLNNKFSDILILLGEKVKESDFSVEKYADLIINSNFYQRIELCASLAIFEKNMYNKSHKYRNGRNELIHKAFLKEIDETKAAELFKNGRDIIHFISKTNTTNK